MAGVLRGPRYRGNFTLWSSSASCAYKPGAKSGAFLPPSYVSSDESRWKLARREQFKVSRESTRGFKQAGEWWRGNLSRPRPNRNFCSRWIPIVKRSILLRAAVGTKGEPCPRDLSIDELLDNRSFRIPVKYIFFQSKIDF